MKSAVFIVESMLETDDPEQRYLNDLGGYTVKYLVFPTGNRPYGGGGWSQKAKHRPLPEVITKHTKNVEMKGKSVLVDGIRRLKCNVWDWRGNPIRIDYPELKLDTAR